VKITTVRRNGDFNQGEFAMTFVKHPLLLLTFVFLLAGQIAQPISRARAQEPAQTSAYRYTFPVNLALEAATEAVRVCAVHGYQVTATVVDMDGVPQVVMRSDGATVHTGESSYDKAYTVATLGPIFNFDTSGKFFELVKTSPYAPRLATMNHVMALPGGVAFKVKSTIVGALGELRAETRTKPAHKPAWRKSLTAFPIKHPGGGWV
jgi:uncharacterized protein GlcG (DUF336 family)